MTLRTATVLLLAALAVAGCGRKGGLEPPGQAVPAAEPTLPSTVLGTIARPAEPATPEPQPDEPFVLDPLI